MKILSLAILSLACCSCATVKTISPDNNHVQIEHQGKKSYCEEIPRVYSGFSYNVCLLNGEPSRRENIGSTVGKVPFFVIDAAFSIVADTIVIPYTAVQQIDKGSIKVN
ncbi:MULTISPECIES: YceK/YidQ family lipoprotein [Alteromonas]|jgi:hypothetical protein|uniref:YceK/YidQ family lipoprotein n=1 Tax=Alteromonas stellipolaris TaxID=233316 RepID=A0AAW7YZG1_9ALTE|nr:MULTISPECIES: YceK/YidQ family lipoprotein [Alteromonas]AMJ90877.1 hypothetical protein AV940_10575 [Alteromonas sp. Mac2]ALM90413.1 hypothetical protein AOR13_1372 [Alteromonas stellipolaris LMG 21856]AMJ74581.1 hypothetical protein AVL57_11785 [Alteromonas stellipolaris]AMJ87015.1 hypothetical protein AV939_10805 [Alteromonas sp. Mac1]AMJ94759.1 hypothetical protein AVL56_10940 [Alteromonas stellipolaris]|tara:strand:- start:900 stop:1226 length:327 start_codon:yes stop_codon:yes gene_type:complete